MKRPNYFSFLLLCFAFIFSGFKSDTTVNEGYYAFIVVDGVHKNGKSFTSRIIQFPGYSECNRYRDIDFFAEAKRAFSSYLKTNYNNDFPYGENNNFRVISFKQFSTSTQLTTYEQARQRMTEWTAEQKEDGNGVVHTNFGFSCSNL